MSEPLVEHLRFTRAEWLRALRGTPEDDGRKRLEPMNSIGWIVGHLAWHEQRYLLTRGQGLTPVPALNEVVAWLDDLDANRLAGPLPPPGPTRSVGDGWLNDLEASAPYRPPLF